MKCRFSLPWTLLCPPANSLDIWARIKCNLMCMSQLHVWRQNRKSNLDTHKAFKATHSHHYILQVRIHGANIWHFHRVKRFDRTKDIRRLQRSFHQQPDTTKRNLSHLLRAGRNDRPLRVVYISSKAPFSFPWQGRVREWGEDGWRHLP